MAIRAVTFDVGGTLIEPFPSVGAVYAQVAREHGHECCPDALTRQFGDFWSGRARFEYTRAEWFEAVQHSFRGHAEVSPDLFGRIYDRFTEASSWRLFDDALPALRGLAERGVRLAVISNWDDRLEPLLVNLGIRGYFEHLTVSGILGRHKPDGAVFAHALQGLRLEPGEVLHVGDSLCEDVEGARAAGLRAARIRRRGLEQTEDLTELTVLPAILEKIEKES